MGTWGGLSGKERTALKRQTSRANGTKFGRARKVDNANSIATAKRMKVDGHTGRDIAKYLGVSRATLYRYLDDESCGHSLNIGTRSPLPHQTCNSPDTAKQSNSVTRAIRERPVAILVN
jgi:Helix-turn-helix domain of resolvase